MKAKLHFFETTQDLALDQWVLLQASVMWNNPSKWELCTLDLEAVVASEEESHEVQISEHFYRFVVSVALISQKVTSTKPTVPLHACPGEHLIVTNIILHQWSQFTS